MKLQHVILTVLIAFALGFFLGRLSIKKSEKVEYVKGETVNGTVYTSSLKVSDRLTEFKADIQSLPMIFWIIDTVTNVAEVDTAKIIEEFLVERKYDLTLFDDEKGKLDVSPTVQFNRLQKIDYSFTPIQKVITKKEERLFVPFVSASYSTLNYVGAGGGFFLKDLGLEYKFNINTEKNSFHEVGLKYKF